MPDDLAWLPDEIKRKLNMNIGPPPKEPQPTELPKAQVNVAYITQLWVRWLPASIMFFGLAFVAWFIIQVVVITGYQAKLDRTEHRVELLEKTVKQLLDAPTRPEDIERAIQRIFERP